MHLLPSAVAHAGRVGPSKARSPGTTSPTRPPPGAHFQFPVPRDARTATGQPIAHPVVTRSPVYQRSGISVIPGRLSGSHPATPLMESRGLDVGAATPLIEN
jgi:hypothetical protein